MEATAAAEVATEITNKKSGEIEINRDPIRDTKVNLEVGDAIITDVMITEMTAAGATRARADINREAASEVTHRCLSPRTVLQEARHR